MGKPFRVEAVLPENARTYFLERDSAAFRSLLSRVLKLGIMEMTDVWRQGESTFVRIVTRPDFGNWVPKGVQSQVGKGSLEFHDVIEYNPALIQRPPFQINVKTESPFLGDKLDVQLELVIEEIDENTCRQVLQGHIKVSMFGIGRIVEGIVKDSLQNTYKKLPEIVRRWQAFRTEALKNGNAKELLSGRPPVGQSISWIRTEVLHLMQSPIEAQGLLPPAPSPVDILQPDDRSHFSTDEGAGEEPAPAEPEPALEKRPSEALSTAVSMMRSATEYYDANDALDEDSVTSSLRPASEMERATSMQRRHRLQQLPPLEVPEAAGTAPEAELIAALPAGPRHRRNLSGASADSCADSSERWGGEPSPFQRRPTSHRSWRGFNNSYEEWTTYWDLLGVKHMAPREPPSGPFAYLYKVEDLLRSSAASVMCSAYLFAMKKGLITVEPNEDGRYAGRPPRLELDPRASQPGSPRPSDSASPLLMRQRSAPSAQQQPQQGQHEGEGSGGGGRGWASGAVPAGAEARVGLRGGTDTTDAGCPYGNTDQAAALVARVTMRALPGPHRRSVSVDSGTTAAAAAELGEGKAGGGSARGGFLGGGRAKQLAAGTGMHKRRATAQVLSPLDEDRVSPPKGFSCIPVCWHRRKPTPHPKPSKVSKESKLSK